MKIRNKLFILVFILLMFILNIKIKAFDTYYSGDLVRYKNIAFYVLFDSDSSKDSVQLIKMVPLSHDEINKYTDNKAYYKKVNNDFVYEPSDSNYSNDISSSYYFYGNMAYYYGDDCYTTSNYNEVYNGCKQDYESSNVKKVVDAWTNEKFEIDDLYEDEYGYKSRLLKTDEYLSLITIENGWIKSAPNWLVDKKSHDWTMDIKEACYHNPYSGTIEFCYNVVYSVYENRIEAVKPTYRGAIRPTVTLKKNLVKKVGLDKDEYHNNANREYKIGDIINYNEIQFYVIRDSDKDDNTVTLLKRYPLTRYELNTYGEGYINNYISQYNWKAVEPGKIVNDNNIDKVAYLSTEDCKSSTDSGCNPNYAVSNVKHIVDNWVNASIDDNDLQKDSYGYKSRLINSDDLINLGFIGRETNTSSKESFKVGNDTASFMLGYETKGMLTMIHSLTYEDRYNNNCVSYGISIADSGYSFASYTIPGGALGTVRPVITLNKKEIAKKITNVEEDEEEENVIVNIATN